MQIDKLICNENVSLVSAMKIINDNAMGIIFVVDSERRLLGTVTDGDIRRALLKGVTLAEKIINIVNKECTSSKVTDSYECLMKKISNRVKIVPILDEENKVVDFFKCQQNFYFPVAIPNLNGNEFKYLMDAFLSTWISSSGEYIGKFENSFASYCDCKYGIAVSNGTVALHLALVSLGIGPGDEVIVPDLTFAATINSVLHANATPVIVDVEEDSWCIDPKRVIEAITKKTKAIIPVHLYGQSCDMDAIMKIAKDYNLYVVEDCAEAHGACFNGSKVGSFGDIGCFSFFGNKVITTGEGGMCVTNSHALDEKMRCLRDHGMSRSKKYWHEYVGYNYRMTNLQAAIGLAQLERIELIHENRKRYEIGYRETLGKKNIMFQQDIANRQKIVWLVSILLNEKIDRDLFLTKLKAVGIDARPFFYPLSDMPIYMLFCRNPTPISHLLSKSGVNLPTYEGLKSIKEIQAQLSLISEIAI